MIKKMIKILLAKVVILKVCLLKINLVQIKFKKMINYIRLLNLKIINWSFNLFGKEWNVKYSFSYLLYLNMLKLMVIVLV